MQKEIKRHAAADQTELLLQHLERLRRGKFFGQLILSFQAGELLQLEERRTLKLKDLAG